MFSIEDWWAGDMQSFFKDIPAAFNIEALENSKGFRIDKPGLENLFEKVPKFERYFRIITQNSYITQQQRIVQNLSFTAEEKFLYFEKKYPKLLNRVSQKQIASYLGVTPEFLSVLKKRLLKK